MFPGMKSASVEQRGGTLLPPVQEDAPVLGLLVEGLFFQGVLNALIPLYLTLNPRRNKSRDGKHVLWSLL